MDVCFYTALLNYNSGKDRQKSVERIKAAGIPSGVTITFLYVEGIKDAPSVPIYEVLIWCSGALVLCCSAALLPCCSAALLLCFVCYFSA